MTRIQTVAFSKNSTNLFFHILTKCNLTCRHCYINPAQHGKNTLPLATIKAWLDVFSDHSDSKNLIFLGGEPTLHPQAPDLLAYAASRGVAGVVATVRLGPGGGVRAGGEPRSRVPRPRGRPLRRDVNCQTPRPSVSYASCVVVVRRPGIVQIW